MVMLVGGCSKADSPAPLASVAATTDGPSVSPSPSKSPTVAPIATGVPADVPTAVNNPKKAGERPPIPPALGYGPDDVGSAINFAKFFIQTIDWAGATDDPAYMRHYFATSCTQCKAVADGLAAARKDNDRNIGGRMTVHDGEALGAPAFVGAKVSIEVRTSIDSFVRLDHRGNPLHGAHAQPNASFVVSLKPSGPGWTVVDLRAGK
jgi:hypothetical protein